MNEPTNPYTPPSSSLGDGDHEPYKVVPAGKWLRFANLLIDYVGYIIFSAIIGISIALTFGETGIETIESIPDIVIGLPIILIYYIVLESTTGRTLGKFITGTRVVNAKGLSPTFGQIVGRSLSRLIPFEAFSFLGEKGRGWHDSIPNTYVIKTR